MLRSVVLVGLLPLLLHGSAYADYTQRADVRGYMAELAAEHDFEPTALSDLFSRVDRKQSTLDAIARPAERVRKWHEYRDIFLGEPRISQGVAYWEANEDSLLAAEAAYGIPPEYVLAILGVETRYGRITGGYRVVDALTTLAFDYPPRADFFRRELTQFLLLAREEGRDPLALTGSYAGAMGHAQFMPSSFRHYAVDFDGDGRRDIWENPRDVVGSIANYLQVHGWQPGESVVLPVPVIGDAAAAVANDSLELDHTVAELVRLGVVAEGLDADRRVALFRMEGLDGAEYWLGLQNFHVLTRYNRSRLYALAVHQLAEAIVARRAALAEEG